MFELENCVAYIATNAGKNLADGFEKLLKKHGISRVQWTALYYLGKFEKINQKELAILMKIKESSMTRLIDRMERDGWIERLLNPKDRREVKLILTKTGKRLGNETFSLGQQYSDFITKDINKNDLATFYKVQNKLIENAQKEH
jgi:DNA-binding MarR family transcriptional regulator